MDIIGRLNIRGVDGVVWLSLAMLNELNLLQQLASVKPSGAGF
jgi:hypothetical protein